ncbi:MAG: substrate-binding domain-containing protein [Kiritimatiellae bacterium]|nr:substrate-binding domain-containing protein [Kiritimatiellia bacterium]
MKKLLFITDKRVDTIEQKLSGIHAGAKALGWSVQEVELERTERTVAECIRFWKPDGCIVDCDTQIYKLKPAEFAQIPFVYLDCDERLTPKGVYSVRNDSDACTRMAFRELQLTNAEAFAYIPWESAIDWSLTRQAVFLDLAHRTGKKVALFRREWSMKDPLTAQEAMASFIAALPKPCAVLAANDEVAGVVVNSAASGKFKIPSEVVIVGIDNSTRLCENLHPSLSSVQAGFEEGGRRAVEMLDDAVEGRVGKAKTFYYPPKELVRRQSTRRLKVFDPAVEKAVELIRREAANGLGAADVLASICAVRRTAERRFRQATGQSVLEEILNRRFDAVIEMLKNPNQAIGAIANLCGWESETYLKRYFKKRTGMTMREWRMRH